ncbi:hypothetical protein [Candidatus Nephthysia bennettiae]|uniref:hypothetical protein n=1 Tax=Candidatus Nephthysia bennettiae TaxID=3127016 RepID=UPI0030C6F4A8
MAAFLKRSTRAVPVSFLAVLALLALAAVPAQASGGGTTVTFQLPFHSVFTNRCNGDVANLSGTDTVTITTKPAAHGYTVNIRNAVPDLTGSRVLPEPPIPYTGADVEQNHQYVADPPYPSTVYDYHYTKLVPHSSGPTMYLVIFIKTVIAIDGTPGVPVFSGIYLTCAQPWNERDA